MPCYLVVVAVVLAEEPELVGAEPVDASASAAAAGHLHTSFAGGSVGAYPFALGGAAGDVELLAYGGVAVHHLHGAPCGGWPYSFG